MVGFQFTVDTIVKLLRCDSKRFVASLGSFMLEIMLWFLLIEGAHSETRKHLTSFLKVLELYELDYC